jgi:glycosyltransferase involved in cell wall biosynthesis
LVSDFPSVRVVNSFEKGLSKSRNLGLLNAHGKIVLLADDDEVFKGFEKSKQNIIIAPKIIAVHSAVSTDDKLNLEERYFVLVLS